MEISSELLVLIYLIIGFYVIMFVLRFLSNFFTSTFGRMYLSKYENTYVVRNNNKIPIIHTKPESGVYLSVIYQLTKSLDVSIEQIKIMKQLLDEKLDENSYEIICSYPNSTEKYTSQLPEIRKTFKIFPYQSENSSLLGKLVEGTIRARGKYVIDAHAIIYELDKIPKDGSYFSVISPKLDNPPVFYKPNNILIPVCGSKEELMQIFLKLHNINISYGAGTEISYICKKHKIQMDISKHIYGPSALSFWRSFFNNIYSVIVSLLCHFYN
ncbi:hypothetical protein GPJ56_002839 [Histomonas meleagridis]|uniref:uncharacterized protein n=1 Tax=Histomonas meleagridis TaxID=135588 RepID=UPI00355A575A|nr:hypothetical protein GPJ56_002839 [Histomonas meleagridis]KAH0806355.1 hypothetical protein GO595_001043 [Histomonas meleagridis]